ncbi:MAG: hypothetical protein L0220_22920 [Acidobacteria bacterium]|nr:hypothetical protein [Acidobacteriota bacterium]
MKIKNNSGKKAQFLVALSILTGCLTIISALPQPSQAQTRTQGRSSREVYTGTIVFIPGPTVGGPGRTRTTTRTFSLTITCTTSNSDFKGLADVLKDDGQDGLLKAIGKEKCGVMQIGSNVGRDINVVRVSETEEGERKIDLLFERWLEFFEVRRGTRSRDYPFTYLELYIDQKGKLEGTMIPAARIRFKGENTVEIENFAAYPARVVGKRRN